jgi:alanyl-tRNA synthetase
LSTSQIREMFLSFFESKGHLRFPSHPIPVYDDPTLMFSVAGMAQFKPQFVGAPAKFPSVEGEWKRVTTAQKCIRIGDIENVGRTSRHCSLFEMLGNFSFDSYFKKEAIEWAWEFITSPEWLGYDPNRIYVTIYKDDEEAFEYWTKNVGLETSRVNRFDADENFWPQNAPKKGPNGPCGPCSEIFYDRGEAFGSDTWADYAKNPESDRFLEFWNLVFPGYNRTDGADGKGHLEDLGRKNIDTGLGMIRAAFISQGVADLFDTDDFKPLIAEVEKLSGKLYEGMKSLSHRVIAEHIRMVSMTLADGVSFGTSEREYVVRKVMRRASRHAYLLGLKEPTLYKLVPIVVDTLGKAYPELVSAQDSVTKQIEDEEKRFLRTLENGMLRLEESLIKTVLRTGAEIHVDTNSSFPELLVRFSPESIYRAVKIYGASDEFFDRAAQSLIDDLADEDRARRGATTFSNYSKRFELVTRSIHSSDTRGAYQTIEDVPENVDTSEKIILSGEDAFTLYDTYGFPLDLTKEIAEERRISVDEDGFKKALERAQDLARAGSKYGKSGGVFNAGSDALDGINPTEFVGYETNLSSAGVQAILKDGERVTSAVQGDHVEVILDVTPFYAEGGGQVGDVGRLEWNQGAGAVSGTHKNASGIFMHSVQILRGTLEIGMDVEATVEYGVRAATERHHTATHLLQAALRATLGTHVQQKGSLVSPDRLRFDFTHNQAVTPEELRHIEALVNRWVQADFAVSYEQMSLEEARKTGAMALFGEKYGDTVRVVSVEGSVSSVGILDKSVEVSSMELCGGTHVPRTGSIGSFVIVSEEGVAAGVRRLEALCGEEAVRFVRDSLERTQSAARALNVTPETLPERLEKLQDEFKAKDKEIAALKQKLMQAQTSSGSSVESLELGGFKIARLLLSGISGNELRGAADDLLEKTGADIVVVASDGGLAVKASKDAVARGAHAGQLIGKLAAAGGGKGGGRPDMAQAGVKDVNASLGALEGAFRS